MPRAAGVLCAFMFSVTRTFRLLTGFVPVQTSTDIAEISCPKGFSQEAKGSLRQQSESQSCCSIHFHLYRRTVWTSHIWSVSCPSHRWHDALLHSSRSRVRHSSPPVSRPLPDALLCTCLYKFFLPATRPGHVTVPSRTCNRSKGGFFVAAKPHASLPNPHERTAVQRQHLCESNCYFHHAAGTGM